MAQQTATHIHWDNEEWEEFATLLDQDNPADGYLYSTNLAELSCPILSRTGAKMRRPRQFFNLAKPRMQLLEAYARLRAKRGITVPLEPVSPPAAEEDETRTRWTPGEWDDFAKVLHEDNSRHGFMHSPDLAGLTIRQLNDAAAQMSRPRHFSSIGRAPQKLREAYARLRANHPEGGARPAPASATGVRRAPPPSAPSSPLKLDANNRPLRVPPEQRAKPVPASNPFTAVAWDRREWLVIATEIDRMYPLCKYPEREHLTGLSTEDVAFAQRLLPQERQSRFIKVATFSTLVPALKEAFEDLRRQRRAAELEQRVVDEAERHAKDALTKAAIPPQTPLQAAATPAPAAATPTSAPAPEPAAVNPWEAAYAPAIGHMLGMLVNQLRPVIAELIEQALNAPAPAQAQTPAAVTPPDKPEPATVVAGVPAAKAQETRVRIGIVGSERQTFLDDMRRSFPNVDFSYIDSSKNVRSVQNCERVLVLTRFISHGLMGMVKKVLAPDQFIPVHGTLSDMRRVLSGLLNGRTDASQPVHALAA